jgi:hypothetical protein
VVECDLAKVEVAGSNPVSRSKDLKAPRQARGFARCVSLVPDGLNGHTSGASDAVKGAVAKW